MSLYDMDLGQTDWFVLHESRVTRVPGGWWFFREDTSYNGIFVPYNTEFAEEKPGEERDYTEAIDRQLRSDLDGADIPSCLTVSNIAARINNAIHSSRKGGE